MGDCAVRTAVKPIPLQRCASLEPRLWLFSRRGDFWFAGGGASLGLLAALALIFLHGDREFDALDFVLSEFHLGATYGVIARRRLWRDRRTDVVMIPLVILALTYVLAFTGQTVWLTTITLYAAVWHRGRQSFGVARFYQRQLGGPASRAHDILFRGAIYLPMVAAMLAYNHLAPEQYDGQPYLSLAFTGEASWFVGIAAVVWVLAYFAWVFATTRSESLASALVVAQNGIHPGEWWVVASHAVAFGSAYVLGASNASFILVLAVHHEVQYLYFTYAMARRGPPFGGATGTLLGLPKASYDSARGLRHELKFVASFVLWPIGGFVGAVIGAWLDLKWLAPLGVGGLFCHYWLDGRIWTQRPFPR